MRRWMRRNPVVAVADPGAAGHRTHVDEGCGEGHGGSQGNSARGRATRPAPTRLRRTG